MVRYGSGRLMNINVEEYETSELLLSLMSCKWFLVLKLKFSDVTAQFGLA